jgi:hypothetical protein
MLVSDFRQLIRLLAMCLRGIRMHLRLVMLTLLVVMGCFTVVMRGRLVLGCRSIVMDNSRVFHGRGCGHESNSFNKTSNIRESAGRSTRLESVTNLLLFLHQYEVSLKQHHKRKKPTWRKAQGLPPRRLTG